MAKGWMDETRGVGILPVAKLGVLETNLDPVVDTLGPGLAAETLESNAVVDLLRRLIIVRDEEDHGRPLLLIEELVADKADELFSALLAAVVRVGVDLGDRGDAGARAGDADDGGGLGLPSLGAEDVVDVHLAVGDVAARLFDGILAREHEWILYRQVQISAWIHRWE